MNSELSGVGKDTSVYYFWYPSKFVDRDSSVGIATRYGLDGAGIEFLWG